MGATGGVGSSRELPVRAALGEWWLRQSPGWHGMQWVGDQQAFFEYTLCSLLRTAGMWVSRRPTALECPWHGDCPDELQIKQGLGRDRVWKEPFLAEGLAMEQSLQAVPLIVRGG